MEIEQTYLFYNYIIILSTLFVSKNHNKIKKDEQIEEFRAFINLMRTLLIVICLDCKWISLIIEPVRFVNNFILYIL